MDSSIKDDDPPSPATKADAPGRKPSAANTRRAYASDWKHYSAWCRRNGLAALPAQPETIGRYIAALASGETDGSNKPASRSTIERRLSALTWNFAQRGLTLDRRDPQIAAVLAGINHSPTQPSARKETLLPGDVTAMLETLERSTLRGLRDRAILLLGFAGGLRRSEIVGLDCGRDQTEDGAGWIEVLDKGLVVRVSGKTGFREIKIARGSFEASCPVAATETWLKFARIARGPLFRRVIGQGRTADVARLNDRHIARLVKQAALAAGIRGELSARERAERFSSHSLCAGYVTGKSHASYNRLADD